jgi:hypothetical protein
LLNVHKKWPLWKVVRLWFQLFWRYFIYTLNFSSLRSSLSRPPRCIVVFSLLSLADVCKTFEKIGWKFFPFSGISILCFA